MKFDGYLFVTDIDGTLLNSRHRVSEKNIRAIEYFTGNGGLFTVATGRSPAAAREKVRGLAVNAPGILQNGAVLYDFASNSILYEKHIAEERKGAVRIMHEKYPFLGFEIYTGDEVYIYAQCHKTDRLNKRRHMKVSIMTDEAWSMPWTKLLMIGTKETLDEYIPVYRRYDSGHAVRSGDEFFDIVSDDASKGGALTDLAKMLGVEQNRTIAAGDNLNDIDLLSAAGISYAVGNAAAEVKKSADFIAPSCDNNAIAWIISEIEKNI